MVLITVKNEFQLTWASETGFSRACLHLHNWTIDWPVCCGRADESTQFDQLSQASQLHAWNPEQEKS